LPEKKFEELKEKIGLPTTKEEEKTEFENLFEKVYHKIPKKVKSASTREADSKT